MDMQTVWIILAAAAVTYLTRISGHVVLSRFKSIPPRVDAALNAVPAAVLTAIVAPYAVFSGPAEALALGVTAFAALRLPALGIFAAGWIAIISLRHLFG